MRWKRKIPKSFSTSGRFRLFLFIIDIASLVEVDPIGSAPRSMHPTPLILISAKASLPKHYQAIDHGYSLKGWWAVRDVYKQRATNPFGTVQQLTTLKQYYR